MRFVVCGGGVTLAASALLVAMTNVMPFAVANAIVTVVSTVVTTELHARVSFRSDERGWRTHLKSAGTVAVSFAFTTAAMMLLHMLAAAPGVLLEQAVYLGACGLAGIGRFVVLRLVVFASRPAADDKAAAELSRRSVVMAA
ncbi:MAG: hypothetical protein HOV68_01680 [Streptomycetaceae bacterium]|nr:hypothetical protein [Streptomycetaceae bacterium]